MAEPTSKKARTAGRSVTAESLRASAAKMLDYYTARQLPTGQIEGCDDPCHYCKLPNALVWAGRIEEADKMLDFCVKTFFRQNGDFSLKPSSGAAHFAPLADKTLHWEFYDFYAYLNQWWITAGIRLSRFDFVPKAFDYVVRHWYNPKSCAGILQEPLDGKYENCIFTSAHLGFSMLHMGDIARARLVGSTIVRMVAKQPDLDNATLTYYNRFDDEFNVIKSWAKDDKGVKLAAIVDGKKPTQCWWSLGYPMAFLTHLYMTTKDEQFLLTAQRILDFASRCHDDIRNNIVAHKVMWGASLIGTVTPDAAVASKAWTMVNDIAGHIIEVGQVEDGRVHNWGWQKGTDYGEAQVIDQTGEIAYWFYVVARQFEKAQAAGKNTNRV